MTLADELSTKIKNGTLNPDELRELAISMKGVENRRVIKEVPFKDSSEAGEAFANLDNNAFIDMNSRLSDIEISAIDIIDELKNLGVFPQDANITQTHKRLKVSLDGKGRGEKVSIVTGTKEKKLTTSFADLFKKKEEPKQNVTPTQ